MLREIVQEEKRRLEETFEEINRQILGLPPLYDAKPFEVEWLLNEKRIENRHRLETIQNSPYFGRIDFQELGDSFKRQLYIGKRGMDSNNEPYIIDWRAPIASLFYSFTGGDDPVSYEAPDGMIVGEVFRKRNIALREKDIDRVVESYLRGGDNVDATDEFLLYRLGEKKDNQLRDIVSTIQSEQDKIIRAPLNTALIIQGAAGSGKTTVALHRLAYLLYNYQGKVRADQMIIFAPNIMFLEYISGVLPELGVGNVRQTTFTEWALEILGSSVKFNYMMNADSKWIEFGGDRQAQKIAASAHLKGSLEFKCWIDRELDKFEEAYLPSNSFEAWDGCVLDAQEIHEWFNKEFSRYPIVKRRERVIGKIKRWMNIKLKNIANLTLKKELTRVSRQRLNKYVKGFAAADAFDFYKYLFYKIHSNGDNSLISHEVAEETYSVLRDGYVLSEDLAALIWIHRRFNGVESNFFSHVVVDEAQDISPYMISVMNSYMIEPSFTILGDLAQGIYSYRGINKWDELIETFKEGQTSYHELRQSYRSTYEIIQFANQFIQFTGTDLTPSQPVFRSGEAVKTTKFDNPTEQVDIICNFIQEQLINGMKSIAVICRTTDECKGLKDRITTRIDNVNLIVEGQQHYKGGITIVPVYLSKGLEFDAVLMADVDAFYYDSTPQNAKFLYVGCTRALHKLELLYFNELSPLIMDSN